MIEENFFDCFEINNCDIGTSKECSKHNSFECFYCESKYPEITDTLFLGIEEVILNTGLMLLLKSSNLDKFEYIIYEKYKEVGFCERETRKEALLQLAINIQKGVTSNGQEISYKREIKKEIQRLFNGE